MEPYDWAKRFEQRVKQLLLDRDHAPLLAPATLGEDAALAIPTPDHYLPLLYILGAARPDDEISFPVEGTAGGSIICAAGVPG